MPASHIRRGGRTPHYPFGVAQGRHAEKKNPALPCGAFRTKRVDVNPALPLRQAQGKLFAQGKHAVKKNPALPGGAFKFFTPHYPFDPSAALRAGRRGFLVVILSLWSKRIARAGKIWYYSYIRWLLCRKHRFNSHLEPSEAQLRAVERSIKPGFLHSGPLARPCGRNDKYLSAGAALRSK